MKPCDRADSLLSAYLDQEASPAEIRFMEDHLAFCARCRANVDEVAALMRRLPRLPRVAVSEGFTERVLAEVKGRPLPGFDEPAAPFLRPRFAAWGVPLAAAAALVIVAAGVFRLSGGMAPWSDRPVAEVAGGAGPLDQAVDLRERGAVEPLPSAGEPPAVSTLADVLPGVEAAGGEEAKSLGMANDAYALEDWVLRGPTEGGAPVMTRVGSDPSASVVVTF